MRILVTGGSGFLGRHLWKGLAEHGDEMVAFDRVASGTSGPPVICGDVADPDSVRDALHATRPDAVVHMAALLTPECDADPVVGTRVNCLGTVTVMHAALESGVPQIINVASVASEMSVYGATKAFGERLARALSAHYPTAALAVLRLGWVYGPGRTRGWNAVQDVIAGFARGDAVVDWPDYTEPLDWTHVDDVVGAVRACLSHRRPGFRDYDLRGDYRTVREAVDVLRTLAPDVRATAVASVAPPSNWEGDPGPLSEDTGYVSRVTLEKGISRTFIALQECRDASVA